MRNVDWNEETLKNKLAGKIIGHQVYYFSEIDSTNDEAFELAAAGSPEGTVVIADSQTKGKGRLQRVWHSPSGSNIYTSIILRPNLEPDSAPQISILAGVAIAEIMDNFCAGMVNLKWPNDVLLKRKKVCGILAQMKTSASRVDFVILGIGINVNIDYNQLPGDIKNTATSLAIETGHKISRQELIIGLYENLAKWYKKLMEGGFSAVKEKWLSMAPMIGKRVQIMSGNEMISGKALGIDEQGSLLLLTAEDRRIKISAGDATILKETKNNVAGN
jgi:BirA family biotin operon repressor/biotin-[acetyl-CoA-carboxylase] ligase